MQSVMAMNLTDKPGQWRSASTIDMQTALPRWYVGQMIREIRGIEPLREWFGGVVCLKEIKKSDKYGQSEYLVKTKAYDIPVMSDQLISDLFDLSLTHILAGVDQRNAAIYVKRSEDGQTNIDQNVMDAVHHVLRKPIKPLVEEMAEGIAIE